MTPPSHPKKDGNPFARPSIWPPMPKTAFRVAPPPQPKPDRRPAHATQAAIFGGSAVPLPRREPEPADVALSHGAQRPGPMDAGLFEPRLTLASPPPPQPAPARPLPQSAPPIPQPRPIPDGPVTLAGSARARRDRPPILALTVASLSGGIGLAALFLLLGRATQPSDVPQAAPATLTASYVAPLSVGQVISPIVPDLRGPVVAADAETAPVDAVLAPAPASAAPRSAAPRSAPIAPVRRPVAVAAAVAPPPRTVEPPRPAVRPTPQPPAARTAALPRLTGPMSDEPFLTVTTRRIAPAAPAPEPSPAAAQALADAPFVSPRRPAVPLVPYIRPPAPAADEPIPTTRFGEPR